MWKQQESVARVENLIWPFSSICVCTNRANSGRYSAEFIGSIWMLNREFLSLVIGIMFENPRQMQPRWIDNWLIHEKSSQIRWVWHKMRMTTGTTSIEQKFRIRVRRVEILLLLSLAPILTRSNKPRSSSGPTIWERRSFPITCIQRCSIMCIE